jgi:hypothetical protein
VQAKAAVRMRDEVAETMQMVVNGNHPAEPEPAEQPAAAQPTDRDVARAMWATMPFSLDALRGNVGNATDPLFEYCMANPDVDMEECRVFHAALNQQRDSVAAAAPAPAPAINLGEEVPPMISSI